MQQFWGRLLLFGLTSAVMSDVCSAAGEIAFDRSTIFCACFSRGMSIIWQRKVKAPLPSCWCCWNTCMSSVAQLIFSAKGANACCTTGICPGCMTCCPLSPMGASSSHCTRSDARSFKLMSTKLMAWSLKAFVVAITVCLASRTSIASFVRIAPIYYVCNLIIWSKHNALQIECHAHFTELQPFFAHVSKIEKRKGWFNKYQQTEAGKIS